MAQCQICAIIQSDNNDVIIQEAAGWRVVLMENQGVLGAMYLTTVNHYQSLGDLTDHEWLGLRDLTRELEAAISQAFHPVYFNFACDMNDAARDGEPTHVHFKLRPRYASSIQVAGEVFVDDGFGSKQITPHKVDKAMLYEIRKAIMRKFDSKVLKVRQQ